MAHEIERKFLVADETWRGAAEDPVDMKQGYFDTADEVTVRVRTRKPLQGDQHRRATLCIKGRPDGLTRPEFEYEVPFDDASEMLEMFCDERIVEKTRYHLTHDDHLWEIDAFEGAHSGLVVAEVELESEDEAISSPPWLGPEVTDDPAYLNEVLAKEGLPVRQ